MEVELGVEIAPQALLDLLRSKLVKRDFGGVSAEIARQALLDLLRRR